MKTLIELLKHPLISYWSLAFFAYGMLPYIIKTWNKKVGTNYVIFSKRHYLFGYIALILATLHSIAWLISWNLTWVGIAALGFIIVATFFGYLYWRNRKQRIWIIIHGLLFVIGICLTITHSIWHI